MGQKVNPLGFRLGVSQKHISHWFVDNNHYSQLVVEDQFIRHFFSQRFPGIASINIKRDLNKIAIEIFSTNTRDLFIEGGKATAKATFLGGEKRVEGGSFSDFSGGTSSTASLIDNLCNQLLKELTIFRHTQSPQIKFQSKGASQSNRIKSKKDQAAFESHLEGSPTLAESPPQTERGIVEKPAELALYLTKVEEPNRSAACLAEFIVEQLEKRVPFRRVLKRSIQKAEEASVEGIKVQISGRLNGAEIARSERIHKGQVPLHTLRAQIEYNSRTAKTIYGLLGVKVWVFNGFADPNQVKLLNQN